MSELLRAKHRIINRTNTSNILLDPAGTVQTNSYKKFDIYKITASMSNIRANTPDQLRKQRTVDFRGKSPDTQIYVRPRHVTQLRVTNDINSPIDDYQVFSDRNSTVYIDSPPISNRRLQRNNILMPQPKNYSPNKPKQCTSIIVQQNTQNYIPFDTDYPPNQTALFCKKHLYIPNIQFIQIESIFIKILFNESLNPQNIKQSHFSNPYYLATLQILSQFPQIFINSVRKTSNPGIYSIFLCCDGVWRYIQVDTFVPLLNGSLLLTHLTEKGGQYLELVPTLLEKAISKYVGSMHSYHSLKTLSCAPFIKALTGAPISTYSISQQFKAYLPLIDAAIKQQLIVILQNLLPETQHHFIKKGLRKGDSYRVIQLRRNCLILLNRKSSQGGSGIISLSYDECQSFGQLMIVKYHPNYYYTGYTLQHKKHYYSTIKMEIKKQMKCYIDVSQIGLSKIRLAKQQVPYQVIIRGQTIDFIQYFHQSAVEFNLKAGTYLIDVHLCQKYQQDFILSIYSQAQVQLLRIKNMHQWDRQCFCQ